MNEADTRAEYIDPLLNKAGWSSGLFRLKREYPIWPGRIEVGGKRKNPLKADYVLFYNHRKVAVVEAKPLDEDVSEGVAQAKNYASLLQLDYAFCTNGKEIYKIDLSSSKENLIENFPDPNSLVNNFKKENDILKKFNNIPYEVSSDKNTYYFQENAIDNALKKISNNEKRILLTLATGTGKTFIAFQIVWKLFHSNWNISGDNRKPRVLFLTDRNFLADQAFNDFSSFESDCLVRIKTDKISKEGEVPTNGNIFFTIFQTFMSGDKPYFGDYPKNFFDLIIIDECHRGGADNESNWRSILEYFNQAVQLGLTATPRRENENIDTYEYFGKPAYVYSLKQGINDGFLTPFKLKQFTTTMDNYIYSPDDEIIKGEIDPNKIYKENDFNINIRIKEREEKRVETFLSHIDQNEKTLVFCANQPHAALIRDIINQKKSVKDIDYCHRVTAKDGELGESYLKKFQDNENLIPTILTTSRKLSTGVNARNIRNIILLRPIRSMIEFKQIIGRGTRLFDGKEFFSIYDFVGAYNHFNDPDWDGEPIDPIIEPKPGKPVKQPPKEPRPERIDVKLADGKKRNIQVLMTTSYLDTNGNPISSEAYINQLFENLPVFFKNEDELRKIWSIPSTRIELLNNLEKKGFNKGNLLEIQSILSKQDCDVYDVLNYIAFTSKTKTRKERTVIAKNKVNKLYDNNQLEFIEFLFKQYEINGVFELNLENLPDLISIKYGSFSDAATKLGEVNDIQDTFINFQKHLY